MRGVNNVCRSPVVGGRETDRQLAKLRGKRRKLSMKVVECEAEAVECVNLHDGVYGRKGLVDEGSGYS